MMCRFISCNKRYRFGGGGYVCGGRWETSVPSAQFRCEPQTAVQN